MPARRDRSRESEGARGGAPSSLSERMSPRALRLVGALVLLALLALGLAALSRDRADRIARASAEMERAPK